jgi:hypothetical protein
LPQSNPASLRIFICLGLLMLIESN